MVISEVAQTIKNIIKNSILELEAIKINITIKLTTLFRGSRNWYFENPYIIPFGYFIKKNMYLSTSFRPVENILPTKQLR